MPLLRSPGPRRRSLPGPRPRPEQGGKLDCPSCRNANPAEARFCVACGAKLERVCPHCGSAAQASFRFCSQCGQELSKSAAAPEAPGADVPASSPGPPRGVREGERRQATILFSDLSGYTAMNEMLDPEEVERVMRRIKGEAVRIVEGHGGIVNQFVGDEVLALFGIPTAHEDDPRRAVQAALELHELVRGVSPEVEGRIGRPLRMHTGINTGLIVTNLRDDGDGRYGITGDTVNTGARLKAMAEDDQVLVSPDTPRGGWWSPTSGWRRARRWSCGASRVGWCPTGWWARRVRKAGWRSPRGGASRRSSAARASWRRSRAAWNRRWGARGSS